MAAGQTKWCLWQHQKCFIDQLFILLPLEQLIISLAVYIHNIIDKLSFFLYLRSQMRQLQMLKKQKSDYGGTLQKKRKGRIGPRPLATKHSMHLVLRSSKAKGEQSFRHSKNRNHIERITTKFAKKYGVRILSLANVGNHLHYHIQLTQRLTYKPFIRALTSAIAMAVTGTSRWRPLKKTRRDCFWDYRPFTRIVFGLKAFLALRDYVEVNQLEGLGVFRERARFVIRHGLRVDT